MVQPLQRAALELLPSESEIILHSRGLDMKYEKYIDPALQTLWNAAPFASYFSGPKFGKRLGCPAGHPGPAFSTVSGGRLHEIHICYCLELHHYDILMCLGVHPPGLVHFSGCERLYEKTEIQFTLSFACYHFARVHCGMGYKATAQCSGNHPGIQG